MTADYPILGPPTISESAFAGVLSAAHSPAAKEAAGIYAAFASRGVDPAIGLAIAQHESSFGKSGIAVGRSNIYGNRYYASQAAFGATNVGGWAKFPTYAAGAAYEASLLAGPLYGGSSHYNTARTFPFRYAPARDHNSPANYGNAIVAALTRWSSGTGAIAYHPSKVAATAAHAAAQPVAHHGATAGPPQGLAANARAHPKATAAGLAAAAALVIVL